MKAKNLLLTGLLLISLTSCASIINGPTQQVPIASNPAGADIEINGFNYGKTPAVVSLKRGQPYTVRISKPGYEERTVCLTNHVSGAVAGNLFIPGGLIGMGVDAGSGSMYKLSPNRINVGLNRSGGVYQECDYPVPGRIRR